MRSILASVLYGLRMTLLIILVAAYVALCGLVVIVTFLALPLVGAADFAKALWRSRK